MLHRHVPSRAKRSGPFEGGVMRISIALLVAALIGYAPHATANEVCEAMATDCRAKLLALINTEMVGLDAGMEEITDTVLADAIIARHQAHVPVRLIVEPRRTKS